jgi:formylglycine-generating enzyme required for sulfatase activity
VGTLESQFENGALDHEARARIGEQLNQAGDTRPGVGLRADGLPDIAWCCVETPLKWQGRRIPFKNERGEIYGEFALESFFIARYPVTYRQFQAFVVSEDGFQNETWWRGLTEDYRKQEVLKQRSPFDNHPRDGVSWYQAVAFARWLNAKRRGEMLPASGGSMERLIIGEDAEIRLPLEWEWHWAAQGQDERAYPWGNDWDARFANTRECRLGRTTAVGMYPHGASWCGAEDMSGTVWEWCLNEYKNANRVSYDSYRSRELRGGAFIDIPEYAVCASRFNDLPNRRLDYFGFRVVCARTSVLLNHSVG